MSKLCNYHIAQELPNPKIAHTTLITKYSTMTNFKKRKFLDVDVQVLLGEIGDLPCGLPWGSPLKLLGRMKYIIIAITIQAIAIIMKPPLGSPSPPGKRITQV